MANCVRKCTYCGQFITLSNNTSGGHWIALDPTTGENHGKTCNPVKHSVTRYASSRSALGSTCTMHDEAHQWKIVENEPFTYPTKCWICQTSPIFAHSNGHGDFVLLDPPLGSPWKVHACYSLWQQAPKLTAAIKKKIEESVSALPTDKSYIADDLGLIISICPETDDSVIDNVVVLHRGENSSFIEPYWRHDLRPGTLVLVVESKDNSFIIPFTDRDEIEIARRHLPDAQVLESPRPDIHDQAAISGTIIGIEDIPPYLVGDFKYAGFTSEVCDRRGRLCWMIENPNKIIPVIVRQWYSNQLIGTQWRPAGKWRNLAKLWWFICDTLSGPSS